MTMMDHSAEDFKSLTAAIEHIKYTAVVKDTSTETGEIFVRKDQKVRIDFQCFSKVGNDFSTLRTTAGTHAFMSEISRAER